MTEKIFTITALHFKQGGKLLGTGYTVTTDSTLYETLTNGIVQMGRFQPVREGLPCRSKAVLGTGLGINLTVTTDSRFFLSGPQRSSSNAILSV